MDVTCEYYVGANSMQTQSNYCDCEHMSLVCVQLLGRVWKLLGILPRMWSGCVGLVFLQIIFGNVLPNVDYDVL